MKTKEQIKEEYDKYELQEEAIKNKVSLDEILAKTEFSADDLVKICKGFEIELVEFFADDVFALNKTI